MDFTDGEHARCVLQVLDWLAYPHLADTCRLFTAAPSKRGNTPYHAAIVRSRLQAGFDADSLLDRRNGTCPEPTIYFELGCSSMRNS